MLGEVGASGRDQGCWEKGGVLRRKGKVPSWGTYGAQKLSESLWYESALTLFHSPVSPVYMLVQRLIPW